MTEDQKKQLEAQLWNIADSLRGKMNADEFRDYCLGFIFYKYLSERQHLYANEILAEDGLDYLDIDENTEEGLEYLEYIREESVSTLGYFLKPEELFSSLVERALGAKKAYEDNLQDEDFTTSNFILDDLTQVLNSIEKSTMGNESEEDFDHLFEDLDLTSTKLGRTPKDKNALIAKILVHLDKIDFGLKDTERDILGDAYEYLIGQFASGAGKKAGEFYTPQGVSRILAKIVTTGKKRLKSVYDPTCGSGSLLLRVAKEVQVNDFFGQEMNRTTYNLARMNMILHGVHYQNFDLRQEDTLERPQHEGKKFEAVVANPPFSANWSANKLFESDDRFSQYGCLAPKSKADFAFVQHMLHHLADNGIMAVVLPHGVLFRGATEGKIRQYLIKERNWLDAVIGLPANIFYGTSIPTCILVFKKCRENPDDILFIDASGGFEKMKNQNYLRDEDIDKIINTFRGRLEEERFSYRASLTEIEENDFNLNIPRYVDTFEEEENIDLTEVMTELNSINQEMIEVDQVIQEFCQELGINQSVSGKKKELRKGKKGKNVPLLRFPEFSGKWENKKLGDISNKISDGIHSTPKYDENGEYYFINGNNLINDKIKFTENTKRVDQFEYLKYKSDLTSQTILMSINGTIGNLAFYNNEKIILGKSACYINLKLEQNKFFVFYVLQTSTIKNFLNKELTGSTIKNLSLTTIKNTKILFPCYKEQEKIAEFLGQCDRLLILLRRKRELLETYKRGVMQLLFTHKIGVQKRKKIPNLRFANFTGNWKPRKLKDFIYKKNINAPENIPLYSLTIEKGVTEKTDRYVRDFLVKNEEEAYKLVEINDFVYNPMNVRLGALARHNKNYSVKVSKYYDVFSLDKSVNINFVELLLKSYNSIQYYDHMATGSLIEKKRLHFTDFLEFTFLFPSLEEQEKIAEFLTAIDKKIEMVGRQIDGREKFKQGLLQKMFV